VTSSKSKKKPIVYLLHVKVKVICVIYTADRKATTQVKLFLLYCVNPVALPLVRCYLIRLPMRETLCELQQAKN